ncbi:MAG: universal stress protein [Oxalobacter sp.]|jgi:nucleotide-binding universal stress UspA family protein|nr:MAG: universal stress protein [Oxalobacter sp.]
MYKKILVTTDGSEVSAAAAIKGVTFAKSIGAEVVGMFVAPEYQYPVYVEIIPPTYPSEQEYETTMKKAGEVHLKPIQEAAQSMGVKCTALTLFSDVPAQKIADAATENACDLIFMGSHGRTGLNKLLVGSVTARVLGLSRVPVLVDRLDIPAK